MARKGDPAIIGAWGNGRKRPPQPAPTCLHDGRAREAALRQRRQKVGHVWGKNWEMSFEENLMGKREGEELGCSNRLYPSCAPFRG